VASIKLKAVEKWENYIFWVNMDVEYLKKYITVNKVKKKSIWKKNLKRKKIQEYQLRPGRCLRRTHVIPDFPQRAF
jgi:hypothetical protein